MYFYLVSGRGPRGTPSCQESFLASQLILGGDGKPTKPDFTKMEGTQLVARKMSFLKQMMFNFYVFRANDGLF